MKLKKLGLTMLIGLGIAINSNASLLNDMQSCQGLLDFLDKKLEDAPSKYSSSKIEKVKEGLNEYNEYIQDEIIKPGLLNYTQGDKQKAQALQSQIDEYKKTLVNSYNKRYKDNNLYMDYTVSVNNCTKKAVPKGNSLEKLKTSLNTLVELSKIK